MDRIDKALKKLSEKEKIWVKEITKALQSGRFDNLNIKKLKIGYDIFRVRKGRIRIIYQIRKKEVFILKVGFRKEDTYRL
ncbi:MAG: hypothetical protein A3B86_04195 [Candidatus Yanofskybacteria bacterium RIFCSPHIGHO2_02_FULL_38_22b]|uniref:Plasmid stabilization protein n=1 Tax=Candidatus Yanofskybacteria bacterium RIFCSPHIGHO2_02_FULL_38_22b TaxID=1802673 RepID=A0A1F8EZI2_9BACT|nr:MAG: hypothetical protein A2816_01965 [Candidatus Yanofskybacteria bacterium RIFCSPHIGHO2_01_FULL_39_44]OGN06291.1 MAG: hypothetical protein A3B86_04195 [Candidatus Yanofskybacteria bacterium RIFCSPHIGHO2_02_FULL_38_22b]OGN19711.1 MAG: hypothetical protein A2910_03930 [Candidatus Yanofskybacteria bacterium RIFCSPLOWO2_01_FULL_39_28]